jgi:hypothetical protein
MIRRLRSGPSVMLKTTVMTMFLLRAAVTGAQSPEVYVEPAEPSTKAPSPDSDQVGFHDLICKPNGSEDGFDCADEATPAKIVPIPSQVQGVQSQDEPVSG